MHSYIYRNILFFALKYFRHSQKRRNFFYRKFHLTKNYGTWNMANNFALLRSFHLLLSTSLSSHDVSLQRNINFVYEISRRKYNAFRKFSPRNIFVRIRNDENFWHEIFLAENVRTKIFHTNCLELKLT